MCRRVLSELIEENNTGRLLCVQVILMESIPPEVRDQLQLLLEVNYAVLLFVWSIGYAFIQFVCLPVCLSVVLDKLWNSSQILRRNATSSYREHLIGVGQRSALEFLNVRSLNDALSCFVGKQKLQGNARTTGERRGRKGSDLRSCFCFVT